MKTKRVYPYVVEEIVSVVVLLGTLFILSIIVLEFAFQDVSSSIALLLTAILAIYNILLTFKKELTNYWSHVLLTENYIVSYRAARPLCHINRKETVYYTVLYLKEYRAKTEVIVISNSPIFEKNIINNREGKVFRYSAYFSPTKQIVLPKKTISIDGSWVKESVKGAVEF